MTKTYSIAEARNKFTSIVRDAEAFSPIKITRHGEPVAVLMSWHQYQQLSGSNNFWESYGQFQQKFDLEELDIDPDIFESVREKTLGREIDL
jgi:prevent-host-death family protein